MISRRLWLLRTTKATTKMLCAVRKGLKNEKFLIFVNQSIKIK